MNAINNKSIAVALAWPKTFCKQAGAWYDHLLKPIGINKSHYYQAGHAAIVLINGDGECYYFDFGRYHAPFGFGRVRGGNTDPELRISTAAKWRNSNVANLYDILFEIAQKEACHGQGPLYASTFQIDFNMAFSVASSMQAESPIKYGPFVPKGTNCSRFVNEVIKASCVSKWDKLKLRFPCTLTPSPFSIVYYGLNKICIDQIYSSALPQTVNVKGVLCKPLKKEWMRDEFIWHSGEGGGSWFDIEMGQSVTLKVSRYSADGALEFTANFSAQNQVLCQKTPIEIGYLSNFEVLNIRQGKTEIILKRDLNIF